MRKILVVDDGSRGLERMLSVELAELGYSSVTASVDAAEDVLALMPAPDAVVLHLPRRSGVADTDRFAAFAALAEKAGFPVVTVDPDGLQNGSAVDLQSWMCTRVLNTPSR